MRGGDPELQAIPVRGQSPVGNGCGEGFPEPLQGRDMAPRIARITRVPAERVCGNVTVGAIWSAAVHRRFFDGAKIRFLRYLLYVTLCCLLFVNWGDRKRIQH